MILNLIHTRSHIPYKELESEAYRDDNTPFRENFWDLLNVGDFFNKVANKYYFGNSRIFLDVIGAIWKKIDALLIVIIVDHTERFGARVVYGHPQYGCVDALRRAPWIQIEEIDSGTYEFEIVEETKETVAAENQLNALRHI